AAARQRLHVVARQLAARATPSAIETKVTIACKQRGVAERRAGIDRAAVAVPAARDDRMQAQDTLVATLATKSAMQREAWITQRPGDRFANVQASCILPTDPVEDAPARVERQHARGVQVGDRAGRIFDGTGCVRVHGSRSIEQIAK